MSNYVQGWEDVGNAPTSVGGRSKVRTADKIIGKGVPHAARPNETTAACGRELVYISVGSQWPPLGERCRACAEKFAG
jgi:hypothetical protein